MKNRTEQSAIIAIALIMTGTVIMAQIMLVCGSSILHEKDERLKMIQYMSKVEQLAMLLTHYMYTVYLIISLQPRTGSTSNDFVTLIPYYKMN